MLTVCAVVCGADDWEAVEMWGEAKLEWLRQYIPLKNGIPSHDTIGRLFAAMNSTTFQACFTRWVSTICGPLVGQVVAIDGKTIRGSHHHRLGKKAIVAQGAHYVLALKGNHGNLHEQVGEFFEIAAQHQYQALDAKPDDACEKDHGRIESRRPAQAHKCSTRPVSTPPAAPTPTDAMG
ncbi:MAG: ISAs1 family transposase [Glaciimonas sp.]|nr:ISAs1 family transposase [Glaciimonas sp.]